MMLLICKLMFTNSSELWFVIYSKFCTRGLDIDRCIGVFQFLLPEGSVRVRPLRMLHSTPSEIGFIGGLAKETGILSRDLRSGARLLNMRHFWETNRSAYSKVEYILVMTVTESANLFSLCDFCGHYSRWSR